MSERLRVVVWSTGDVGTRSIRAISERPDLDLVGVWVHSPEKEGRDAGELSGIEPIGVAATNDVDALLGLRPDCVCFSASDGMGGDGFVDDYEGILAAGINVVSSSTPGLLFHPGTTRPRAPASRQRPGMGVPPSTPQGSSRASPVTSWS